MLVIMSLLPTQWCLGGLIKCASPCPAPAQDPCLVHEQGPMSTSMASLFVLSYPISHLSSAPVGLSSLHSCTLKHCSQLPQVGFRQRSWGGSLLGHYWKHLFLIAWRHLLLTPGLWLHSRKLLLCVSCPTTHRDSFPGAFFGRVAWSGPCQPEKTSHVSCFSRLWLLCSTCHLCPGHCQAYVAEPWSIWL